MHSPPKSDGERIENLLEALSERHGGPDAIDEMIQADLAERGQTMESYVAELQAKGREAMERHERARWARRNKTLGAIFAGFAFAASIVLIVYMKSRDWAEGELVQPKTHSGCACEVASASSRGRELLSAPAAGLGLLLALLLRRRSKGRHWKGPPSAIPPARACEARALRRARRGATGGA
jgi:MYXO-CTERM domain-containing protein